ncbi:MAG: hypothetical protein NDI90_10150 [Nitrospira sp. BO4]|nr:hypothetical protein [Nitrospira sp. BO4]
MFHTNLSRSSAAFDGCSPAVYSKAVKLIGGATLRTPNQITVDRALLLYVLQLAERHGQLSDVKLQQLCFLCELQTFAKGVRAFHFEFFRFAYGAFSKDLDNDLTSLRRKGRVENFIVSDQAKDEAIPLLLKGIEGVEANEKVKDIIDAVVTTYGPQDSSTITNSVELVQLSTPQDPEFKIPIRDIVFHTTLLVPHRIDVQAEFTLTTASLSKLNAALGYDSRPAVDIHSW